MYKLITQKIGFSCMEIQVFKLFKFYNNKYFMITLYSHIVAGQNSLACLNILYIALIFSNVEL